MSDASSPGGERRATHAAVGTEDDDRASSQDDLDELTGRLFTEDESRRVSCAIVRIVCTGNRSAVHEPAQIGTATLAAPVVPLFGTTYPGGWEVHPAGPMSKVVLFRESESVPHHDFKQDQDAYYRSIRGRAGEGDDDSLAWTISATLVRLRCPHCSRDTQVKIPHDSDSMKPWETGLFECVESTPPAIAGVAKSGEELHVQAAHAREATAVAEALWRRLPHLDAPPNETVLSDVLFELAPSIRDSDEWKLCPVWVAPPAVLLAGHVSGRGMQD